MAFGLQIKKIYEKNGFVIADKLGRFELMFKDFDNSSQIPRFINWTTQQAQYQGWNLVYSDQCPWHEKAIVELRKAAIDHGIDLKIKKITTPQEAQNAPSGFGTFSLLKDGKLLEDHYISRTRFENIIKAGNK